VFQVFWEVSKAPMEALHPWDALKQVHRPKTLVDIVYLLTILPSETPDRWRIVRDFFSKRVSALANLDNVEWMRIVVHKCVQLLQKLFYEVLDWQQRFFVVTLDPLGAL
jgi:hypothetical protein